MNTTEKTYQSILLKLGVMPVDYLPQIDDYLLALCKDKGLKSKNREEILALAGIWNDLSEQDFQDFRKEAKNVGNELFGRNVEL